MTPENNDFDDENDNHDEVELQSSKSSESSAIHQNISRSPEGLDAINLK